MTQTTRSLPKDPSSVTNLRLAKILPWLIYAYLLLEVIVLTLAFFLLLFNASTEADFTQWVYRSADRALEPFRGIFPSATADNGSVLDFAVLFAIIVYGILAMIALSVIHWIDRKIMEERAKARWLAEGNTTAAAPPPITPPRVTRAPRSGARLVGMTSEISRSSLPIPSASTSA